MLGQSSGALKITKAFATLKSFISVYRRLQMCDELALVVEALVAGMIRTFELAEPVNIVF